MKVIPSLSIWRLEEQISQAAQDGIWMIAAVS